MVTELFGSCFLLHLPFLCNRCLSTPFTENKHNMIITCAWGQGYIKLFSLCPHLIIAAAELWQLGKIIQHHMYLLRLRFARPTANLITFSFNQEKSQRKGKNNLETLRLINFDRNG
jgi:hypothetical protein